MTEDSSKEFDLIPGQTLQCEVLGSEGDGLYKITSQALGGISGFLRCTGELAAGTKLEVCFVCMHQGMAVFMPREPIQNLKEGTIARAEDVVVPPFVEEEGFNANVLTLVLKTKGMESSLAKSADLILSSKELTAENMQNALDEVDEEKQKSRIGGILEDLNEQKITLETYLERKLILSREECNSISRGKALLDRGAITWEQFAVAFWDELVTGLKMEDSLTVRGWL